MKKVIIGIIIGILISGISVFASSISVKNISYTPNNKKFSANNIGDALDLLFDNYDNNLNIKSDNIIDNNYSGNALNNAGSTINLTKGKYVVFGVYLTSYSDSTSSSRGDINLSMLSDPLNYNGCDCEILDDNGNEQMSNTKIDTNSYIGAAYLTTVMKCDVKITCSISMQRKYDSYNIYTLNTSLKAVKID